MGPSMDWEFGLISGKIEAFEADEQKERMALSSGACNFLDGVNRETLRTFKSTFHARTVSEAQVFVSFCLNRSLELMLHTRS